MSLGDLFTSGNGTQTQAEADANYARQQQQFQAALLARQNAGTLTDAQAAAYEANTTGSLDSTSVAAGVGALQGATEIFTDPSQWWADTQTGAGIAGSGIKSALGSLAKAIPWWGWLAGGGAIFFYLGGFAIVAGLLRRR
jgi:hypothetical protein